MKLASLKKLLGTAAGVIALVAVIVLAVIFWPFAILWAINTIFPVLAIQYNFWTWLAVLVLNMHLYTARNSTKGK